MRAEQGRKDDPRLKALRDGWVDVLTNSPPRAEYETASKGVQGSYENGRLLAMATKQAGLVFPFWPEGSGLPAWWSDVRAFKDVVPNDRVLDVKKPPPQPESQPD